MPLKSFKYYCQIDKSEILYTSFMEEVVGDISYQEFVLSESNFLIEKSSVNPEGEEKLDNDTMGKLHEILFAAHTHGGVDKNGKVTRFPEDTRSKGKKAEDIYKALVKKIGGESSTAYKNVNAAAKDTAAAWVSNHIPKGHKVTTGHWSSQAGDHGRITGIADAESKADVIIQSEDEKGNKHFHPVSLKYTKSDPNLANNGLERISSESGLPKEGGSLSDSWKEHMERTSSLHGGSAHQKSSQFKVDALAQDALSKGKDAREAVQKSHDSLVKKSESEGGLNPKYQARLDAHKAWLDAHDKFEDKDAFVKASADRAAAADDSKTKALSTIASRTANSYNMKGDAHIRGSLVKLATPHTVLPHTLAVSYTKDDGSSTPFTTTEHNFTHDHLHQFENLRATSQGNGVVFYGKRKGTKDPTKETRVATLNFKGGNGPYEGANSTLVMHGIMRDTMERQSKGKPVTTNAPEQKETTPPPSSSKVDSFKSKVNKPTTEKPLTTKPTTKPVAKPVAKPAPTKTPSAAKPQPPAQNKPVAKPAAYDYKGARGQDLGKLAKSGDETAQKEINRRKASI